MIKSVINISRAQFKRINFYPTSFNPTKESHAFISIYGNELDELPAPKINKEIWLDGIQLQFDDVEEDYAKLNLRKINKEQADQIIQFVNKIHFLSDEINIVVHCFAGISRSAAIGKFINDAYYLNLPNYNNLSFFNTYVYKTLLENWREFLDLKR